MAEIRMEKGKGTIDDVKRRCDESDYGHWMAWRPTWNPGRWQELCEYEPTFDDADDDDAQRRLPRPVVTDGIAEEMVLAIR